MNEEQINTEGIHGLRAIMALIIVGMSHYPQFPLLRNVPVTELSWLWTNASYCVDGFFVISGFIITYGYLDKIRNQKVSFNLYIKKRLSKVYPMFLVSLIGMIVFQLIYARLNGGHWFSENIVPDNNVFTFLTDVLCMQGMSISSGSFNQAAWFLSALIFMYILFYFFTWMGAKYNVETTVYYLLLIMGIFGGIKGYPALFGTFIDVRAFQGFFAGCLLYKICIAFKKVDKAWLREFIVICIEIGAIAILIADAVIGENMYGSDGGYVVRRYVVIDVLLWPMIIFVVTNVKVLSRCLGIKPLKFLSKISFCMYIIHYPLMVLVEIVNQILNRKINYSSTIVWIGWIFFVIFCGSLCWKYIEDKCSKFLRGRILDV